MGESRRREAVASLCSLVLRLRLVAVLLTALSLPPVEAASDLTMVAGGLLLAAVLSALPVLLWERVGPVLLRHPLLLVVDVALALALLRVLGPVSPFVNVALASAVLAGVLYRTVGAVAFSILLVASYVLIAAAEMPGGVTPASFQAVVGTPALFAVAAAAGAGVRRLLDRQQEVETALAAQERVAAAASERARLAREMHDSLAKTIHGIALSAAALPLWVERSPGRAVETARSVSAAAERAAMEARELIADLRTDRMDCSLPDAVREHLATWSASTGIDATLAVTDVPAAVSPSSRYELFCVLKEILRNVERHAAAGAVHVGLRGDDDDVVLSVADDGIGMPGPVDLDALVAAGHYGVVGLHERCARLGGRLTLSSSSDGTTVEARVPIEPGERTLRIPELHTTHPIPSDEELV